MGCTLISDQQGLESIIPTLMGRSAWGFDTETTGLNPHKDKVILVQFGTSKEQFVIDARKVNLEPLRVFLEDKTIKKIGHNAKFDYKMVRGSFGICVENLRDTMYAEKLLNMGRKFGGFRLDDVVKNRLGIGMEKDVRSTFGLGYVPTGDFTEAQIAYAAKDVEVLLPLLSHQLHDIVDDGLVDSYLLECAAIPCFGDMEFDGMYLDSDKWKEIIGENEAGALEAENALNLIAANVMQVDMFGDAQINWSSPDQVLKVLKALKVKVPTRGEDGSYTDQLITSSDDKTLKKAKSVKAVELLKKYRGHKIRVNTFGYPYLNAISPETGRLHPEFEQIGTETGRPANKSKKGSVNLLNIPRDKKYRNCFRGDSDEVVETDDYSGCETRIWAEISGDPGLTHAFANGIDVHCYVASMIFGKEVGKKDPERTPAKSLNFGIAYGLGPFSFFEQVNGAGYKISYEGAKVLFHKYEGNFKDGIRFLRDAGRTALEQGYLSSISGRRRYWLRPDEEDRVKYPQGRLDKAYKGRRAGIEREGGNFLIQSVNADMTKRAMVLIRDYIKKNNIRSKFMNQVYDEIVTRTHKDDSPDFVKVKRKLMIEAAQQYLKKIPMEVDGHVGDSWTK